MPLPTQVLQTSNFLMYPFVIRRCSTNSLGHGHGCECHSPLQTHAWHHQGGDILSTPGLKLVITTEISSYYFHYCYYYYYYYVYFFVRSACSFASGSISSGKANFPDGRQVESYNNIIMIMIIMIMIIMIIIIIIIISNHCNCNHCNCNHCS